jgi:hypothetical protein
MLASRVFFQFFEAGGLSVVFTQALILVFGCMPKNIQVHKMQLFEKFQFWGK